MEGIVWFEGQLHDDFLPQYCILDPFRGMRCIRSHQELSDDSSTCLWVFGGDVYITRIDPEEPATSASDGDDGTTFYPFSIWITRRVYSSDVRLKSKSQEPSIRLRLAVTQREMRPRWCTILQETRNFQDYLYACVECGAVPSMKLFSVLMSDQFRNISVLKYPLALPDLGAMVMLCKMHHAQCQETASIEFGLGAVADHHSALLVELLQLMPKLTSLRIFQTQVSDASVAMILKATTLDQLVLLDLSSNTISDSGAQEVARQLPSMPRLQSLNLSNNFIGSTGCSALTRALTAYECQVRNISVAHNPIGDCAGELVAKLLLVREPNRLQHLSVSYCMVGDMGFRHIALALDSTIACSLKVLDLGGNVPSAEGLLVLLRAVYDFHHNVPACQLYLGGVAGASFSETLGVRVAKLPLAQVENRTLLQKVVLRRQHLLADGDSSAALIVLQLSCATLCRDLDETIRIVEEACAAKPGQIAVLAQSIDKTQEQHISFMNCILYLRAMPAARQVGNAVQTPRQIAACLEELAAESHPSISCLDITRVFLPEMDRDSPFAGHAFRRRSAYRPFSQQLISITSNKTENAENGANEEQEEEEEEEEENSQPKPIGRLQMTLEIRPLIQRIEHLSTLLPTFSPSNDVERRVTSTVRPSVTASQRRSTYRRRASTIVHEVESVSKESESMSEAVVSYRDDETITLRESVPTESFVENSSLIVRAVKQLVQENKMTEEDAIVWYGLVGELFAAPMLESLYQQVSSRSALFPKVQTRASLCSAMFERNPSALVDCISHLRSQGMVNEALYHKAREVAEGVISTQTFYTVLAAQLAADYPPLALLEQLQELLQQCADVGMHGKEVFQAIGLRERIVALIQQEEEMQQQLFEMTQTRSYLTNVLISRDANAIRHALNWLCQDEQQIVRALGVPEESSLKSFVEAYASWSSEIDRILVNPTQIGMKKLLDTLAEAAYLGVSDNRIDQLSQHLVQRASNLSAMLESVVNAIETGNASSMWQLLDEMQYCGVEIPAVQRFAAQILERMRYMEVIQEFNLTVSQLGTKQKIGTLSIEDVGSVIYALYTIDMYNIAVQQPVQTQLAMFEREIGRLVGSEKSNQKLLSLLRSRDIEGLKLFLAGRGTGRLIVCCQSDEELRRWMDAVSKAIAQSHERGTLSFEGWLEKQSRGENSSMKNWRQRWFVLDGSYLSYGKEPKSPARGTLYLPGGTIRRLEKHEDGGRRFGIEIIEGHDLTQVHAALMEFAQQHLQRLVRDDLEHNIKTAMDRNDDESVHALVVKMKAESIKVDPGIASRAEMRVEQYLRQSAKAQLEQACSIFSKRALQTAVKAAQDAGVSAAHPLLKKAQQLVSQSEAMLLLLHTQVCLRKGDYRLYNACIAAVKGFRSLAEAEKATLVAAMLENAAKSIVIYDRKNALRSRATARMLRYAIDIAVSYGTELGSMQLARLALQNRKMDEESLADSTLGGLDKFPRLAFAGLTPRKGKQQTKKMDPDVLLSFSMDTLKHCLLRDLDDVQSELAIHLFELLKSVIASAVSKTQRGSQTSTRLQYTNEEINRVTELVDTGVSQPAVRDELYVQLLKQLQQNPYENARLRLWQILSIYLHSFPPSRLLAPYLCNHALALSRLEIPDNADRDDDFTHHSREVSAGTIAEYAVATIQRGLDSNWTQVQGRAVHRRMIECVLHDHAFELQIDIPSHDAVRMYIHVFDAVTVWGIVKRLWWRMAGDMDLEDEIDDTDISHYRYQSMSGSHHGTNQLLDDETFIREKSLEHKHLRYLHYFSLCYHSGNKKSERNDIPEPLPWDCDVGWELLRRLTASVADNDPTSSGDQLPDAELELKVQLQFRCTLPARIAFGEDFVQTQTALDTRLGESIMMEDVLLQWLRSTGQLQNAVHSADVLFVDIIYAQFLLYLRAGMVEAYPVEAGYVLGIELCIKLGTTASDIDTELLRITQLIRNPVVAVKVAQRAKEVASSTLAMINKEGLSAQSPRVHHVLKRAAMDYVQILPMFGSTRFEAHLHTPQLDIDGTVWISCHSLHFVKASGELVFTARLADIESITAKGGGVVMVVNGFRLELLSEHSASILHTIASACLTTLSAGAFERGTAQGNCEEDPFLQEIPTLMRSFLNTYPILPSPPLPQQIALAPEYFRFPPSTRAKVAKERLAQQRRQVQHAIDTVARNAESDLKDMMQMRSGIQSEEETGDQKNQANPHALLYGAVCGVSARRMQYTLPTVEDFVTSQKMHRLKRLNSSADIARAPLGFLAPAEAPEPPTATAIPHPSELPEPSLQWPAVPLSGGGGGFAETKSDENADQSNTKPASVEWSYDAKTFLARSEFLADVIDASMDIVPDANIEHGENDYSGHMLIFRIEKALAEAKQRQEEQQMQHQNETHEELEEEEDDDVLQELGSQYSKVHRKSSLSTLKTYLRAGNEGRRDTFSRQSITSIRASLSSKRS